MNLERNINHSISSQANGERILRFTLNVYNMLSKCREKLGLSNASFPTLCLWSWSRNKWYHQSAPLLVQTAVGITINSLIFLLIKVHLLHFLLSGIHNTFFNFTPDSLFHGLRKHSYSFSYFSKPMIQAFYKAKGSQNIQLDSRFLFGRSSLFKSLRRH